MDHYEAEHQRHEEAKAQLMIRGTRWIKIPMQSPPQQQRRRVTHEQPIKGTTYKIAPSQTEIPKKITNPMYDAKKAQGEVLKTVKHLEIHEIYTETPNAETNKPFNIPLDSDNSEHPHIYAAIPTVLLLHLPLLFISYVNLIRIYCCIAAIDTLRDRSPTNQSSHTLSILILLGCVLSFALPLHLQIYALIGADLLISTYTIPKVHTFFHQKLPDDEVQIVFTPASDSSKVVQNNSTCA